MRGVLTMLRGLAEAARAAEDTQPEETDVVGINSLDYAHAADLLETIAENAEGIEAIGDDIESAAERWERKAAASEGEWRDAYREEAQRCRRALAILRAAAERSA